MYRRLPHRCLQFRNQFVNHATDLRNHHGDRFPGAQNEVDAVAETSPVLLHHRQVFLNPFAARRQVGSDITVALVTQDLVESITIMGSRTWSNRVW